MDFLPKMLCPVYFTLAFLSILYGALFHYHFVNSGLTFPEIYGRKENHKKYMDLQIKKEDFNVDSLEKVVTEKNSNVASSKIATLRLAGESLNNKTPIA